MSAPSLCSALAIADSSTLRMIRAPFFGLNASRLSALSTGSPRIWSATSLPFWAERRTPRSVAVVCMSFPLPLGWRGRCGGWRGRRGRGRSWRRHRTAGGFRRDDLLVRGVRLEGARQRELAELVSDHVFGHVDRDVLLAVVHSDRQAHEVRRDRRAARPGLDRPLIGGRPCSVDLRLQVMIDERSLLNRTWHLGPIPSS